jgi:AcrR family transcriptional regulator
MLTNFHPTKRVLVETLSKMLNERKSGEISVDDVLEDSGVSKGSLYHHFEDFSELLEATQVYRYQLWIDASIEFLEARVVPSKTVEELRSALLELTQLTQSDKRKSARAERAQALAECLNNERLAKQMGEATQRLTDAIADVTTEVKNKGLFKESVSSMTLATFIQAYTLGKIVNDYNPSGVSEDEWNNFIMEIVDKTFLAN